MRPISFNNRKEKTICLPAAKTYYVPAVLLTDLLFYKRYTARIAPFRKIETGIQYSVLPAR